MNSKKRRLVLAIVATDRTFERVVLRDGEAYVGKCIHCNAKVVVDLDGEPVGVATIEHIVPRSRGGTDAIENLALACARCNAEKGVRHDSKRRADERAADVVDRLAQRRRERWR